ncbi:MAG: hypothetical protein JW704_00825 [Anaerolineaceae bacterium]|nr:hypothetical protein [Anaerolineaceae bacterium]MBN2677320.1 hypothetical protein [Anaerolineaceae bacterium]
MYMILLVLDDPNNFDAVLSCWDKIGIRGATIFETTGIGRHLQRLIPMRYVFLTKSSDEESNLTLMVIVENKKMVEKCLAATETVTGDLDDPNTGIFAAWPLTMVKGLPSRSG